MTLTATAQVTATIVDRFTGNTHLASSADDVRHASTILKRELRTWTGDHRLVRDDSGSDRDGGFHAFNVWRVIDGDLVEIVATAYIEQD